MKPTGSPTRAAAGRHGCEHHETKPLLCSDLVQVYWEKPDGVRCREIAILENFLRSEVGLFTGVPVPHGIDIRILVNETELSGRVKQCVFQENGYIVRMELSSEAEWAQSPAHDFLPGHLLDVSLLDVE